MFFLFHKENQLKNARPLLLSADPGSALKCFFAQILVSFTFSNKFSSYLEPRKLPLVFILSLDWAGITGDYAAAVRLTMKRALRR
jgi:hypothetical protein